MTLIRAILFSASSAAASLVSGLLLAVGAPGVHVSLDMIGVVFVFFVAAFIVCLPFAAFIGLPLHFLLKEYRAERYWIYGVAGSLCGLSYLEWSKYIWGPPEEGSAGPDLIFVALLAAAGALGGIMFRAGIQTKQNDDVSAQPAPGAPARSVATH